MNILEAVAKALNARSVCQLSEIEENLSNLLINEVERQHWRTILDQLIETFDDAQIPGSREPEDYTPKPRRTASSNFATPMKINVWGV